MKGCNREQMMKGPCQVGRQYQLHPTHHTIGGKFGNLGMTLGTREGSPGHEFGIARGMDQGGDIGLGPCGKSHRYHFTRIM